jgi:hypothetical protein
MENGNLMMVKIRQKIRNNFESFIIFWIILHENESKFYLLSFLINFEFLLSFLRIHSKVHF